MSMPRIGFNVITPNKKHPHKAGAQVHYSVPFSNCVVVFKYGHLQYLPMWAGHRTQMPDIIAWVKVHGVHDLRINRIVLTWMDVCLITHAGKPWQPVSKESNNTNTAHENRPEENSPHALPIHRHHSLSVLNPQSTEYR